MEHLARRYPSMPAKDEMQYVCEDHGEQWWYDEGNRKYVRFKGNQQTAWISQKYLPDPEMLLNKRTKLYPTAKLNDLKPTHATYELWNHAKKQIPHPA